MWGSTTERSTRFDLVCFCLPSLSPPPSNEHHESTDVVFMYKRAKYRWSTSRSLSPYPPLIVSSVGVFNRLAAKITQRVKWSTRRHSPSPGLLSQHVAFLNCAQIYVPAQETQEQVLVAAVEDEALCTMYEYVSMFMHAVHDKSAIAKSKKLISSLEWNKSRDDRLMCCFSHLRCDGNIQPSWGSSLADTQGVSRRKTMI